MLEQTFHMSDGYRLPLYHFKPNTPAKAAILIIHGAGEHGKRYTECAQFLVAAGFAVITYDQRGHGQNLKDRKVTHMGDSAKAHDLVHDVKTLVDTLRDLYPNRPIFTVAHSMGAFVMRSVLNQYPKTVDGTVLIGSSVFPTWQVKAIRRLAKGIRFLFGPSHVSRFLTRLTQDRPYRAMVKRGLITERDAWVTHDQSRRELAKNDPLIGVPFTITSQIVLMSLMLKAQDVRKLTTHHFTGHMAILCGDEDPVCDFGAGVETLKNLYKPYCKRPIFGRCYTGLRHELLQEKKRMDIDADLQKIFEGWLNKNA